MVMKNLTFSVIAREPKATEAISKIRKMKKWDCFALLAMTERVLAMTLTTHSFG